MIRGKIKTAVLLAAVCLFVTSRPIATEPVLHALKLWGGMTGAYKLYWYWGWAEGLAVGKGEKATLFIGCLESIGAKIAIGTIDRFYDANVLTNL